MSRKNTTGMFFLLTVIFVMFVATACSVDHGSEGKEKEDVFKSVIKGTVSAGGTIKGRVVLKNATASTSSISSTIDENGQFYIELMSNMTGPYILQAKGTVGGRAVCLHSIGTRSDLASTVNITPLTNLVVSHITGKNPEKYFDQFEPALSKIVSQESIDHYEQVVRRRFENVFKKLGIDYENINIINSPMEINKTGIDAFLALTRFVPGWEESDNSLDVRVKFVFSDDEITYDLTTDENNDQLPVPYNINSAADEMRAVFEVFSKWQDFFSENTHESEDSDKKAVPLPDDSDLKYLFSEDDFLHNGYDLESFLEKICISVSSGESPYENMLFSGLSIESLDVGAGRAVVSFTVNNNSGLSEDQLFWNLKKSGKNWKMMGNLQEVYCHIESYASLRKIIGEEIVANGLCVYAWSPFIEKTNDIDWIVVKGSGIHDEIRLKREEKNGFVIFIPDRAEDLHPEGFTEKIQWSEVFDNTIYTFNLFDSTGNRLNSSENLRILKRGNVTNNELLSNKKSFFCNFKTPILTKFSEFKGGDTFNCSWSVPNSVQTEEINFLYDHDGSKMFMRFFLEPDAVSFSTDIQETEIEKLIVYLRSTDVYGRMFDSFLAGSKYSEKAWAKNIIYYSTENENISDQPFSIF